MGRFIDLKTANVPTDFPYDKFKDIYLYAHEQGLKGCTTFRFNPEAFQGVLVKEQDLKNTIYKFTLEDGTVIEARGDEEIEYDGEMHTAANLFDALKEGYYGKLLRRSCEQQESYDHQDRRKSSSTACRSPTKGGGRERRAKSRRAASETARDRNGHTAKVIRMHEKLERPEVLIGSTYKIKTPISDHAMYVTINDIVLNEGTEYEQRRPFEIFINSKNLDHFQWIVALTRIISAVFRKGGDTTFLVDELKAVFDPRGGYWQPGGKFMPSIIAELGYVIEKHLQTIGLMRKTQLDVHQQKLVDQKRAEFEARAKQTRCLCQVAFPGRGAAVWPLQHRGGRDAGWLHDVSELWRFEVWVSPHLMTNAN